MSKQFHELMTDLIALNRDNRARISSSFPNLPTMMSSSSYAQDFCTVHCDIGRRTGKTEFIQRFATPHSVIVVANEVHRRQIYSQGARRVMTGNELLQMSSPKRGVDYVLVDEPSLVFDTRTGIPRETLYRAFENDGSLTFVMVGA